MYMSSLNFRHVTKQEAKLAPTNSTTRIGKTIAKTSHASKGDTSKRSIYTIGEVLCVRPTERFPPVLIVFLMCTRRVQEGVIKYRMRHVLQSLGFLRGASDQAAAGATALADAAAAEPPLPSGPPPRVRRPAHGNPVKRAKH